MKPKVSIIIIAYNREKFLAQAVVSVQRQSFSDWELILLDDGSIDGTRKLMEDLAKQDERIRFLFNEKNLGICKTRVRGLAEARGEFVAVLDSDDVWCDKDKLKKQFEFLKNNSEYVLVGGGVVLVEETGGELKKYLNPLTDQAIRRQMLLKNPFAHSTIMYRREATIAAGGYQEETAGEEINAIEDYDLWLRLGKAGKLANLPNYFVNYRLHPGNISVQKRLKLMQATLVLIRHYRSNYPFFWLAWLRRTIRLNLYQIYNSFIK